MFDPVSVDVVLNYSNNSNSNNSVQQEDNNMGLVLPYVFSDVCYWMATAVRVTTRDRGAKIAAKLRANQVGLVNHHAQDDDDFLMRVYFLSLLKKHKFRDFFCGRKSRNSLVTLFSPLASFQTSDDDGFYAGRVVGLHAPEPENGPVKSGVAVIDEGPFTGQRVEFERENCSLLASPIADGVDLSILFAFGNVNADLPA